MRFIPNTFLSSDTLLYIQGLPWAYLSLALHAVLPNAIAKHSSNMILTVIFSYLIPSFESENNTLATKNDKMKTSAKCAKEMRLEVRRSFISMFL